MPCPVSACRCGRDGVVGCGGPNRSIKMVRSEDIPPIMNNIVPRRPAQQNGQAYLLLHCPVPIHVRDLLLWASAEEQTQTFRITLPTGLAPSHLHAIPRCTPFPTHSPQPCTGNHEHKWHLYWLVGGAGLSSTYDCVQALVHRLEYAWSTRQANYVLLAIAGQCWGCRQGGGAS